MEKFNFFTPVTDFRKAKKDGKDVYYFRGLASDASEDADGETLDPSIFDFSDFKYVNWDHGKSPGDIIGEKTKHWVDKDGVGVEGLIYSQLPKGKETIDLMQALEKSPNGNQLGISVEGQVLQRNIVTNVPIKAKITSMALCPFPKNGNTWAQLIKKSFSGEEIYQEKECLQYDSIPDNNLFTFVDSQGNSILIDKNFNYTVEKSQNTGNTKCLIKEDVESEKKKRGLITLAKALKTGKFSEIEIIQIKKSLSYLSI